ncbi:hypothetical protein [Novosphingobium sp. FKTRR1]|uniref:hypothetical protein n=1 Tax=Novosphingobium sp. FKTRR1 TaxID=2879118 RepID=UPI001CF00250|nr:hypothetical protein [Novosphingobium sp. FKTRR1]
MASILPFVLKDRWIVTVESERHFVKVRHRTRWYAVARRIGHEDRRHWCASRADALVIAQWQRDAFERWAFAEQVESMLARLPPIQRAKAIEKLKALAGYCSPGENTP